MSTDGLDNSMNLDGEYAAIFASVFGDEPAAEEPAPEAAEEEFDYLSAFYGEAVPIAENPADVPVDEAPLPVSEDAPFPFEVGFEPDSTQAPPPEREFYEYSQSPSEPERDFGEEPSPEEGMEYDDFTDEDDFVPASFGQYLSSRLASVLLRIRGNAPSGSTSSVAEEDEDLGDEVSVAIGYKYYGAQIYSLRLRVRIAFLLLLISCYISLGFPVPGILKTFPIAVVMVLLLQLAIIILSLDVFTNGILNIFRKKFGADSLAAVSCLLTGIDAAIVLSGKAGPQSLPLCSLSSLSLFGILFASLLSSRAIRKSLRVPAIGKSAYTVTAEGGITGNDITILKSTRPIDGFVRRTEEEPIDEATFVKAAPFLVAASLLFTVIAVLITKNAGASLHIFTCIFCVAVPFTSLLCFALPYFVGSLRIFNSGCAIAGWSGAYDIGQSKNMIVTDRDLFPAECIEIENVRIFADYPSDKVISYAGTMIINSQCGLTAAFSKLMEENGCKTVKCDTFECLPGGGLKSLIEGHVVICGNADLMRLMDIRIPFKLVSNTSALLSIDGILYGIFNIRYTGDPKVRKALVSLMRSNRHPIFAIRDFNITPDMIHECFDVATDGYDFPPYAERYPLSEAKPSADSKISAVICREGLGPLTDMADTGRSIYVVSRMNLGISLASAFLGLLLSFLQILIRGSVSFPFLFILMLVSALPVLILGVFTKSSN